MAATVWLRISRDNDRGANGTFFSISTLWIRLCVTTIPHVYDDPDIIKFLFNDHNYRLSES